jgi:hypothetical protein
MPLGLSRNILNSSQEDELEIVIAHQGNGVEGLLLQSYYNNQKITWSSQMSTDDIEESRSIEDEYRSLGVAFGVNSGAGTPSSLFTFDQTPSLYHVTFGRDAHGEIDDGLSSSITLTGTVEGLLGGYSGGFASTTTINNSTNSHVLDWVSVNLEPDGYFSTIIRGFVGDPTLTDRAIDVGDPSRTNSGTTGYFDPITETYKNFTDYNFFRLSDNEKTFRNASIQMLKTYDKWIEDGAFGGNFTINGSGISSGTVGAYYEIGGNTQIVEPGASANVILPHIPTYYNMYKALGQAYNDIVDLCRPYTKGTLGFNKPPKMIVWGKRITASNPLAGTGWWNNPPQFAANNTIAFGTDSYNKNAASARSFGEGNTGFTNYIWDVTNLSVTAQSGNNNQWESGGSYPLGSRENRAKAMSFEGASHCAAIFSNCQDIDCFVYQFYETLPNHDLREICATANWDIANFTGSNAPSDPYTPVGSGQLQYFMGPASFDVSATGATLVPSGTLNSWLPKENKKIALYRALRLNWLAFYKHFGRKAAIGTELHFDAFLRQNIHLGFATEHQDFKDVYLKSLYDPITAEEASLYGFVEGEVLKPKYFVFWCASYFFLECAFGSPTSETQSSARKSYINGYMRKNLETRFPPTGGITADWREGSAWHKYLCRQLDYFGLERVRTVRNYANNKRFLGTDLGIPLEEI